MVTSKAARVTETESAAGEPHVPNGYKQTEVGVIPEDWDAVLLDSVAKRGSGHTPDKAHPEYWGGTIKWVSLQDSDRLDHLYIDDTAAKITPAGIANSSAKMHPKGTVVLSRDAGVGKSAIMNDDMAVSQHFMAWACGPLLNNHFLYYWLQSRKTEFERIAMGNTIKTIGLPYFRQLLVPLPIKTEQETIAQALTEADATIESLEQLIIKKRQIKQGSMQELLTGKKRLPGFEIKPGYKQTDVGSIPKDWQVKPLDDLFTFSGGLSASRAQLGKNGYCYLHYGDIHTSTKSVVDVEAQQLDLPKLDVRISAIPRKSMLADGDVVFVDASEDDEGASKHWVVLNPRGLPFISGLHTIVSKSKGTDLANSYKRHCFQTQSVKKQFLFYSVGTKVTGISKTNIKKILLPLPATKAEQEGIAAILSDVDADIAALEEKLTKVRQIKRGMMQELLTGKIRLL
jgi:type I restriction enzyme, S subunit